MTSTPKHIYLDYNATTTLGSAATDAMHRAAALGAANPASQHYAGRKARQVLEDAREAVASVLGARGGSTDGDTVIFTGGGTEANNLALFGLAGERPGHAIVSAIEHPSVAGPADELRRRGWRIDSLPVSNDGVAEVERLGDMIGAETRFVSLMLANNETGVLQPVVRAAEICASRGVPLHTDAVQAVGKIPVDFGRLGAAAMSVSAHKLGGPTGCGALLLRHDTQIAPRAFGGFQQAGLRPGTESVVLAAGFSAAMVEWSTTADDARRRLTGLRDEFEAALRDGFPELIINGGAAERLPQTSNVSFVGLDRRKVAILLDLAGVACSTGSACASGSSEPSPVLLAMHAEPAVFEGSLRFSFGTDTSREELLDAARRIVSICNDLRTGNSGQKKALGGRSSRAILVD